MASDILIYEAGGGGEILLRGKDVVTVNGYENSPFLAMFGGNKWLFNYLIPTDPYASQTEQTLATTPLTSAGRVIIERAINADLNYLKQISGTTYTIATAITAPNRLEITININGQTFNLTWNPDTFYLTYTIG